MRGPATLRQRAVVQWRARLREARGRMGGGFVQPVLTLVSGAAAAQALVYASRPVLTRLYGPEEFGVLTLFVTLAALPGVAGTGRYEDALMLPARRGDAARLLALALAIGLGSGLLLALALPWRTALADALGSPALAPSLVLLPGVAVAVAAGRALETWHTRFGRYRVVAAGRAAQGSVAAGVQLAAGLLGAGAAGLTAGAAAGFAVLLLPAGLVLARRDGLVLRAALRRPREVAALARRYRRFPAFTAPAALLNLLAARVPIFGLSVAFGLGPTGHFGLAFGTLALPVGMVTAAVGQVFFVRAAEAHRHGTLGPLTRSTHRRLATLAAYPVLAAAVAGPELFALVFGSEWAEAGRYARLLAPWLLLSAVASSLTRVFDVTEHQRADLALSVLQAAGLAAALALSARLGDAALAVGAAGAAGAVLRAVQIGWLLRLAGAPLARCAADFALALARTAPFLAAGTLAGHLSGSVLVETAVLAAGGLAYYGWSARADRRAGAPDGA